MKLRIVKPIAFALGLGLVLGFNVGPPAPALGAQAKASPQTFYWYEKKLNEVANLDQILVDRHGVVTLYTYPAGTLAAAGELPREARTPGVGLTTPEERVVAPLNPKENGVTFEKTACIVMDEAELYGRMCWWFYKDNGDEDPNYAYRIAWGSGYTYGKTRNMHRIRYKFTTNENASCANERCEVVDIEPLGEIGIGEKKDVSLCLGVSGQGMSGSVCETISTYPERIWNENWTETTASYDWTGPTEGINETARQELVGGGEYKWRTGTSRPMLRMYMREWFVGGS